MTEYAVRWAPVLPEVPIEVPPWSKAIPVSEDAAMAEDPTDLLAEFHFNVKPVGRYLVQTVRHDGPLVTRLLEAERVLSFNCGTVYLDWWYGGRTPDEGIGRLRFKEEVDNHRYWLLRVMVRLLAAFPEHEDPSVEYLRQEALSCFHSNTLAFNEARLWAVHRTNTSLPFDPTRRAISTLTALSLRIKGSPPWLPWLLYTFTKKGQASVSEDRIRQLLDEELPLQVVACVLNLDTPSGTSTSG